MTSVLGEKGKTMSDYIKREDAYSTLTDFYHHKREIQHESLRYALNYVPSADVAPVRHGHWEVIDAEEPRRYGCSECKRLSWHRENYCPNCGAKMDEGE
jgi:hypothetical protein